MKMGECYVLLPKEEAEETLERKIEECEEQLGAMDETVAELRAKYKGKCLLSELKE